MRVFSGAGPNELKVSAFLEERQILKRDWHSKEFCSSRDTNATLRLSWRTLARTALFKTSQILLPCSRAVFLVVLCFQRSHNIAHTLCRLIWFKLMINPMILHRVLWFGELVFPFFLQCFPTGLFQAKITTDTPGPATLWHTAPPSKTPFAVLKPLKWKMKPGSHFL